MLWAGERYPSQNFPSRTFFEHYSSIFYLMSTFRQRFLVERTLARTYWFQFEAKYPIHCHVQVLTFQVGP